PVGRASRPGASSARGHLRSPRSLRRSPMPSLPDVAIRRILMTADTVGGVWTYALELAQALQSYAIDVVLATMGAPLNEQQRTAVPQVANITRSEEHRSE